MAQRHLFCGMDIFNFIEQRKLDLKAAFGPIKDGLVDEVNVENELLNELCIDVPVLDETNKYARTRDIQVDVRRDPHRMIFDRSRPFYLQGTEISVFIPFRGDPGVFDIKPTAFDLNPPFGDVIGRELNFVYAVTDARANIENENARTVLQIKKYLEWLRPSAEQLDTELRQLFRSLVARRKQHVAAQKELLGSLGIPIRNDEKPQPSVVASPSRTKSRTRPEVEGWDVFISHASEDKLAIARPLADALKGHGLRVWYDDFSLRVGDSLRESIDLGLSRSNYGVVILSPHFFEKHWPQKELNGLATREVNGVKVILPVWHEVGFQEVREYSPTLADRIAVSTGKGLECVVAQILAAM